MDLEVAGQVVTRICFDFAVTLLTHDDVVIRIQSALTIEVAGADPLAVDADAIATAAPAFLRLHMQAIDSASVDETGTLRLAAGGVAVTVPADPAYEAWTLTAADGRMVVCMPGGELAVWRP